jgi:diguanylate cyclase (GGDEF)-like protein/PAS domain S-box-containing protein
MRQRIPPEGLSRLCAETVNHRPVAADNACMGVRWRPGLGVYARVRRGLAALARRSRLAWTGEEQLTLALAAARMGTFEWDLRTNRGAMSPELEAIHGLAPGEFDGSAETMVGLVHPSDREEFLAGFARAIAEGGKYETEFRIVLPTGEVRWRTAVATIVMGADGAPSRIVGGGQDVTDRRLAEETLAEAQARYRRMVEQLPLVTYVESLDAESALYISPQIEELAGYTAEEWVADPNFFGKVLHPDDRDHVLGEFAETHRTGDRFDGEYRIIAKDGRVVWVQDVAVRLRDDAGQPLYSQGYMVDVTARHIAEQALAESRAQLEQRMRDIEHQALHDALTDLPNRTLFHDRVDQALRTARRTGGCVCVMLIDLDRFKDVNDTLGHLSGDVLLQEVAGRLRAAVRESDTVARLGGDEFGVLATGIATAQDGIILAEKLQQALAAPVAVGGLALEVESSIGIALAPDHGSDVETLIRHADVSMYVSKGTHSPAVYCAESDHHSRVRLTLVADLRRALERKELVVYYQPQADAATGAVRTMEALVRWEHPVHGLLPPDQFVPLAEQTGLIRPLTLYMLDAALHQCAAWRNAGYDVAVAVNITGRDLLDLRFPQEVAEAIARAGTAPEALELEITESTIMTDAARARSVLVQLSELGVRLAIDDFGSGHSSLGYLKRLPIDVLKIDRSFVMNMADGSDDAVIVRSTIDLGHNLGLEVVAEGVESQEALAQLMELGCDTVQGYFLGRPQPTDAVEWIVRRLAKRLPPPDASAAASA